MIRYFSLDISDGYRTCDGAGTPVLEVCVSSRAAYDGWIATFQTDCIVTELKRSEPETPATVIPESGAQLLLHPTAKPLPQTARQPFLHVQDGDSPLETATSASSNHSRLEQTKHPLDPPGSPHL